MYGSLIHAFVGAIRAFPEKKRYNLNVIQVNDSEGSAVINTGLPCCTVALVNARKPTTFIGGGIYENPRVSIQVIVDFLNHSSSSDNGTAVKFQNLPYEIRRYVEKEVSEANSPFFRELRTVCGFSAVYDEMKTYVSSAYKKDMNKAVLAYSMYWTVNMLDAESVNNRSAELEAIDSIRLSSRGVMPPMFFDYAAVALDNNTSITYGAGNTVFVKPLIN